MTSNSNQAISPDIAWIRWDGGKCPVPVGQHVEVMFLWGTVARDKAGEFRWSRQGFDFDIIAYRLVLPGGKTEPAAPPLPEPALPSGNTKPCSPKDAVGAPALLDRAAGHMRDRAATYDQPNGERSMGRAVAALNAVLGRPALTESEGWLLLQLLKDVRDRQRPAPHLDSLEDCIAYAALKAEARLGEGA